MEYPFFALCVICILLLLLIFFLAVKRRRRAQRREQELRDATGVEYIYSQQPGVTLDIEYPLIHHGLYQQGQQQQQQQSGSTIMPPHYPPSTIYKPISPTLPPPSYQEYRKDIQIPNHPPPPAQ
ncbi:hypothetical protein BJ944DRAFT_271687 [Cunninghamella echinulata]|nr:hypothetical protein BJ944DRAFT_271687 [Cunninghamella echinulata]